MIKNNIDMGVARVGDEVQFANGVKGKISVIYRNGGAYFLRWDEFDEHGRKQPWSGRDSHCCYTGYPADARMGFGEGESYIASPNDIVAIFKPPLEELQDEISTLRKKISELETAAPLVPAADSSAINWREELKHLMDAFDRWAPKTEQEKRVAWRRASQLYYGRQTVCACGGLAHHKAGEKHQCCECYVKDGNAPADWHLGCMQAHEAMKAKNEQ